MGGRLGGLGGCADDEADMRAGAGGGGVGMDKTNGRMVWAYLRVSGDEQADRTA